MRETTAGLIVFFFCISWLLLVAGVMGLTQTLDHERKIAEGRAYVLKKGAVVETEDENADVVKCYFADGDVIRIDRIEAAGDDRLVTVSYAPVDPGDPATDIRCPAGTSVGFIEMNVEQLIGK